MEVRADIVVLGGSGSGNFDHCGIPGHQGGSRTCKEIVGSGSIPEIDESEIVNDRRTEEDAYDTSDRRLSADEFSNLLVVSKGKISVEDVDPSSLEWSEWVSLGPSEKKVKKMAGDPEIFKVPPIVGRRRDDGVIEIIGGLHRSEVAKKLGVKVRVIIFDNDLFSSTIDGRMDDFAIENYAYFYTKKYLKSIKTHIVVLGGSGSGNFGHCGIPGHQGGSGDCSGGSVEWQGKTKQIGIQEIEITANPNYKKPDEPTVTLFHETSKDYVDTIKKDGLKASETRRGELWFLSSSSYKSGLNETYIADPIFEVVIPKRFFEKGLAEKTESGDIVIYDDLPQEWIKALHMSKGNAKPTNHHELQVNNIEIIKQ